ncbi:unnamed protein product [Calypogeia fissa]
MGDNIGRFTVEKDTQFESGSTHGLGTQTSDLEQGNESLPPSRSASLNRAVSCDRISLGSQSSSARPNSINGVQLQATITEWQQTAEQFFAAVKQLRDAGEGSGDHDKVHSIRMNHGMFAHLDNSTAPTGGLESFFTQQQAQTKFLRLLLLNEDTGRVMPPPDGHKDQNAHNSPENLQKKLKMYKNAINAILVGAAVIASVTFQGFLQAPTDPAFTLVFCIYNSLSFYSAVATMITGAGAALPTSSCPLAEEVETIRKWVRASSLLLAISIFCVLGAVPGPNYGNPPNITKNKAITTAKCVGLFLCAAAMTAYALRLNWKLIHGRILQNVIDFRVPVKWWPGDKKGLPVLAIAGLLCLCGLIFALFLVLLFLLPFYGKFNVPHTELSPAPAPGPGG